jgi:hypothetical protein
MRVDSVAAFNYQFSIRIKTGYRRCITDARRNMRVKQKARPGCYATYTEQEMMKEKEVYYMKGTTFDVPHYISHCPLFPCSLKLQDSFQ